MTKRLYKSQTNKVIAGVCGGIGEYFDMDPVVIRLAYIIITLLTAAGPGILAYIIMMIVIPNAPFITPSKPVEAEPVKSESVREEVVENAQKQGTGE